LEDFHNRVEKESTSLTKKPPLTFGVIKRKNPHAFTNVIENVKKDLKI
jgi:hypothetical protein